MQYRGYNIFVSRIADRDYQATISTSKEANGDAVIFRGTKEEAEGEAKQYVDTLLAHPDRTAFAPTYQPASPKEEKLLRAQAKLLEACAELGMSELTLRHDIEDLAQRCAEELADLGCTLETNPYFQPRR